MASHLSQIETIKLLLRNFSINELWNTSDHCHKNKAVCHAHYPHLRIRKLKLWMEYPGVGIGEFKGGPEEPAR